MIIGVDAGCLSSKDKKLQAGVYQVVVNFLQELQHRDKENTYFLYSFSRIDNDLLKSFGPRVKNIVVRPSKGWTKIWLPLRLLKDKPDVFLGLSQTLPIKLPLQTYKSILLVHDILFDTSPEFYSDAKRLHMETQFAVNQADSIIAVSKAVKKDIVEKYHVVPSKIHIAYEGIRSLSKNNIKINKKLILHKPYFLFVGALKKSKNIPRILYAFGKFSHQNRQYHLYLVGSDKWLDPKIPESLRELPKDIQKKVHRLGFVENNHLAQLYKNAHIFLSPSLYEGFGLPFVEAMQYGIPIIGSTEGAIPEVVGKAGMLVNPYSVNEMVNAMSKITGDKALFKRLSQNALTQAKKFTWEHFSNTIYSIITSYEHTTR